MPGQWPISVDQTVMRRSLAVRCLRGCRRSTWKAPTETGLRTVFCHQGLPQHPFTIRVISTSDPVRARRFGSWPAFVDRWHGHGRQGVLCPCRKDLGGCPEDPRSGACQASGLGTPVDVPGIQGWRSGVSDAVATPRNSPYQDVVCTRGRGEAPW